MKRWSPIGLCALLAAACTEPQVPAAPDRLQTTTPNAALNAALNTATSADSLEIIVSYDRQRTTSDALSTAIQNAGAGVIQFAHLPMVAALATAAQVDAIRAMPGVTSVYLNRQLRYLERGAWPGSLWMLHESVPSMRADQVWALGITGKSVGIAILDSGIDGLYNPDLTYPTKTVQNIKVLANLRDLFTFRGSINKTIKKGATLFVENLPNSETSVGHGSHVAGIAAGSGAAGGGYYTGVAPGAQLIGLGTGDILFIFWALAGFDYILEHQRDYNIQVVNNSWGTSGPFDPDDPINEASKAVHDAGITVVFAAGNEGPGENTLNPYSVAPWVIGVAAGCKLVQDPTLSAVHCQDQTGQNRAAVLADFSSRGIPGDPLYHPDVTAPGVHIVSTRASTGTVLNVSDANHDLNLTSTCALALSLAPWYTCASGTSMATPHVAGVVALMEEASGGTLTPDQALLALTGTARPLAGYATWEVGTGYVDALAAVMAVRK
jgi:serine protease AprX